MLLEIGLFKNEKRKEIKIALSLSYPNSYFCNERYNVSLLAIFIILLIKLLLFVNANVSQDV